MTKPGGIALGMTLKRPLQHIGREPTPVGHLRSCCVDLRGSGRAHKYVSVLVLRQVVPYGQAVRFLKNGRESSAEAEFFGQAAQSALQGRLAGVRVAATGVRPQAPGVVLVRGALLNEEAPPRVKNEDRECAVKEAFGVGPEFAGGPKRTVVFVDQYDGVGHRSWGR